MAKEFKVIEAPTKLDLAKALLDRKPLVIKIYEVRKGKETTAHMILNSITAEDGSAESWLLEGHLNHSTIKFEAWLRTDRIAGFFKF